MMMQVSAAKDSEQVAVDNRVTTVVRYKIYKFAENLTHHVKYKNNECADKINVIVFPAMLFGTKSTSSQKNKPIT